MNFNILKPGDKILFPSERGLAILCEVLEKTKGSAMVTVEGREDKFFLTKHAVNEHAVLVPEKKAKTLITHRMEDPDNTLIYFRYRFNQTLIDKLYNFYCDNLKNREPKPTVIPPKTQRVRPQVRYYAKQD